MTYRFDHRNKKQFAKDIKEATNIESGLMEDYVEYLNSRPNIKYKYSFSDYGVDNSGEFIEDCQKVTAKADYLLHKENAADRRIEIKFCRKNQDVFRLKVAQVRKYIEDDVCIVNFMGIDTAEKRFCIIRPYELQNWLDNGELEEFYPWGNKLCIKFPCDGMKWIKV